nr:MAG TPA: hypothetical protein [Caudoviricetes sp.]
MSCLICSRLLSVLQPVVLKGIVTFEIEKFYQGGALWMCRNRQ